MREGVNTGMYLSLGFFLVELAYYSSSINSSNAK